MYTKYFHIQSFTKIIAFIIFQNFNVISALVLEKIGLSWRSITDTTITWLDNTRCVTQVFYSNHTVPLVPKQKRTKLPKERFFFKKKDFFYQCRSIQSDFLI